MSSSPPSTPPSVTRPSFALKFWRALPWILSPILATSAWFATIFGLLMWWAIADNGRPYEGDQQTILYVSDVGAEHDDLFIAGSVLTAIFYAISLVSGRCLRHLRRLPGVLRKRERVAAIISIVLGILGGFWLIMLSVFNNRDHSTAHWTFAAIFLACVALSALAQVFEFHWLSRSHPDRKHLHRNSIIKMVVIGLAYIGAALFIICYVIGRAIWDSNERPTGGASVIKSVAAVFEWTVAFIFGAYLLTFVLDLWPAHKTRGLRFEAGLIDADRANTLHVHKDGRPGAPRGRFEEMRQVEAEERASVRSAPSLEIRA